MPQFDQTVQDAAQFSSDRNNGCIVPHGFQRSINIFQRVNGIVHVSARLCGCCHPLQGNIWRAGRGQLGAYLCQVRCRGRIYRYQYHHVLWARPHSASAAMTRPSRMMMPHTKRRGTRMWRGSQ
jgi:hypothetical protein